MQEYLLSYLGIIHKSKCPCITVGLTLSNIRFWHICKYFILNFFRRQNAVVIVPPFPLSSFHALLSRLYIAQRARTAQKTRIKRRTASVRPHLRDERGRRLWNALTVRATYKRRRSARRRATSRSKTSAAAATT